MSFALPSDKCEFGPVSTGKPNLGDYECHNAMTNGFEVSRDMESLHPLIKSEKNYRTSKDHMNMVILRNTQGLHAPLRIGMEIKASKKIGHLPFLPSSGVMLDSLTGRDLEIEPSDIFNTSEFREVMGQPHAVVERSLGLL